LLEKDQELTSSNHKLSVIEADLGKAEEKLTDAKHARDENESSKTTNEGLSRKIQLLEEELDNAEKNLKDTVERWAYFQRDQSHVSNRGAGYDKLISRLSTLNVKFSVWNKNATSGKRNTRYGP
jgi:hypothetical protein